VNFKRTYALLLSFSILFCQKEININSLVRINGTYSIKGENHPATGVAFDLKDGKKIMMGNLKNGKKDGVWVELHDFNRRLQETYKDGVLDGFVSIFYENGQKEWRHTYNNGILEGNYTRWHNNGKRAIDGFFENGIPVGVWAWRDENGNIIKKETFKKKKKGILNGLKEYTDKDITK